MLSSVIRQFAFGVELNPFERLYVYLYENTLAVAAVFLILGIIVGVIFYSKSMLSRPMPRIILGAIFIWIACLVLWNMRIIGPYRWPEKPLLTEQKMAEIHANNNKGLIKEVDFPTYKLGLLPSELANLEPKLNISSTAGKASVTQYYYNNYTPASSILDAIFELQQYKTPTTPINDEQCQYEYTYCETLGQNSAGGDIIQVTSDSPTKSYVTDYQNTRIIINTTKNNPNAETAVKMLQSLVVFDIHSPDFNFVNPDLMPAAQQ